jgi:hypothetical protein
MRVKLTLGDHQMVRLMVPALDHGPHKAERFELGRLFGLVRRGPMSGFSNSID